MVRRTVLALAVYAAAACVFTWPLVLHPRALFGAIDPTGDPSLNLWALGWDLRVLGRHPLWFLSGRVFNAPIFFPAPRTLAYSDHLLLQALMISPVYGVTRDLVFSYNVLLLGSLVAAALAMHLLVRELIDSESAAYVGGLIFGFAPFHFTHLIHIQLQALYFMPLSFLFLHRLCGRTRIADALALGVVAGLQAISSVYYGVIGTIGLVCAGVLLITLDHRWRDWRLIRSGLLAALTALIVAAPWSIPYIRVSAEAGGGRNLYETANSSATLISHLQAPSTNLLYGRTGLLRPGGGASLPFKEGAEQALFIGAVPLALAIGGVLGAWRDPRSRRLAGIYTTLALVGLVLSLGPNGSRLLYATLYRMFFGMAAIRAAARFDVLVLAGVSVLAAVAIDRWQRSRKASSPIPAIAGCALIALEYCNGAIAFPPPPPLTTNAGQFLKSQPGPGAVVCVPMGPFTTNTPCMLQGLEHGRPVVNGYSGLRPPFFDAVIDAADHLPSAESLLALHDLGVEFIVSDHPLPLDAETGQALAPRATFDDQSVYQITWSDELESRLTTSTDITPPAPGPPPFRVGETATYHVRWTSGPVNLSAGEATIAIEPPQGAERYRFVVSARTAPWMARFYEADVRLQTAANERLLPLAYDEAISDGRRRTERHVTFDNGHREMKVVSGGTAITFPLGPETRDPISALFYARTLPLVPGDRVALPVNDNGRRMKLELSVAAPETITVGDRTWAALKVVPQLSERLDRRGAMQIVSWLSADERRLPLVVEVTASFGTARLELASYHP